MNVVTAAHKRKFDFWRKNVNSLSAIH